MRQSFLRVICIAGALTISGCGGGGGGSSDIKQVLPESPAAATPITVTQNKLGAWFWYADRTGTTHTQIADKLVSIGVKRIFIKISNGRRSCEMYGDVCDGNVAALYKARGIEPWTWSYNYPNDAGTGLTDAQYHAKQAEGLTQSAKFGYVGHVVDIETEFDGKAQPLEDLFTAFRAAHTSAKQAGLISNNYLLGATTWGNPKAHSMRVDLIDKYVDFHMPQTYLEEWANGVTSSVYLQEPRRWVDAGNKEYRDLGAVKPIWHIVSTDRSVITKEQLSAFIDAAGPNTSIWSYPDGSEVKLSVLDLWKSLDWTQLTYKPSLESEAKNFVVPML